MAPVEHGSLELIELLAAHGPRQPASCPCVSCGGGEVVTLAPRMRDREGFAVVACVTCGLGRLDPMPADTESYYEQEFVDTHNPGKSLQTVRTSGIKVQDAERRLERLAPTLTAGTKVLEVGCHAGTFLHHAAGRSPARFTATELDRRFRDELRAEGFDVRATLDDCAPERYDVILLFHVLEHIPAAVEFLQSLGRLLVPGGRLVIEVPSLTDALLWSYNVPEFWTHYWRFAHVWYFSPAPLAQLLTRAQFRLDGVEPVQRYSLRNHLHWMNERRPGAGERFAPFVSHSMEREYREAVIRAGRTDTLWAEGRRR